jgi:hypothetical protein
MELRQTEFELQGHTFGCADDVWATKGPRFEADFSRGAEI